MLNLAFLDHIILKLKTIKELLMTVKEALDAIDGTTTAIADRIQKLIDQLASAGSLTPEQQAEADAIIAKLTTLGTSEASLKG